MQVPEGEALNTTVFKDPKKTHSGAKERAPPQDPTGFEQDIETLEAMDLGKVTDTIRADCRNRIKQLDLEHLLEQ